MLLFSFEWSDFHFPKLNLCWCVSVLACKENTSETVTTFKSTIYYINMSGRKKKNEKEKKKTSGHEFTQRREEKNRNEIAKKMYKLTDLFKKKGNLRFFVRTKYFSLYPAR